MMEKAASLCSILAESIRGFLAYKRALGCRFAVEEATLRLLDRFLEAERVRTLEQITPALLTAFLSSRPRPAPRSYNHLLCTVRRLFDWLVSQGGLARSPARQIRGKRQTYQRSPYIFDAENARHLLDLAAELPDNARARLRGRTYRTIFALLYGLGLRVGEACRLRIGDADLERCLLHIERTKFYKSRLVPFGPRMAALLRGYLDARRQSSQALTAEAPLFSFSHNRPVCPETISQTFHALVPRLNLRVPPGISAPRLHDLRHSFATGTLLRWYRSGGDPGARLLQLSTFMGHVDPASTAIYLHATEELLLEANRRFEQYARPGTAKGGVE